ncbi:MAG: LysR family transcriptional regulator [Clostridia bacterium]|nr:LysR family transcriptional regulator [Clostridia bacterium]
MEIRNLITFVQVAELNNFTKASKVLDYSQSTVSFQIKQLENELGCLLFERINHTIKLTDKGRELLEYAKKIRLLTDEFNQSLKKEENVSGFLRIVAPDSVCEDMMKSNYTDFHKRYPLISLKFITADASDMFGILDRNEADLMMTLDSHIYKHDYIIAKEEQVHLSFVTGKSSPHAQERSYSLEEIASMPLLLTEKGLGYRRLLDEEMAKHSIEVSPVLELGRTDIITNVLSSGVGVSFLPDFLTESRVKSGELVRLNVPDAPVTAWKQLIYHKNKWLSQAMKSLIEYIIANEFSK